MSEDNCDCQGCELEEYLDKLFEYISRLETRLIDLEREASIKARPPPSDDAWYWDH